jgi:hypothetical protein
MQPCKRVEAVPIRVKSAGQRHADDRRTKQQRHLPMTLAATLQHKRGGAQVRTPPPTARHAATRHRTQIENYFRLHRLPKLRTQQRARPIAAAGRRADGEHTRAHSRATGGSAMASPPPRAEDTCHAAHDAQSRAPVAGSNMLALCATSTCKFVLTVRRRRRNSRTHTNLACDKILTWTAPWRR